ncbi:MAG TPA: hypothetical protein VGU27_03215 [Candidatus Eisenbacteria bacterium]|nr:hypothetical protein [Candidatus Eisenbacteria bacterium]
MTASGISARLRASSTQPTPPSASPNSRTPPCQRPCCRSRIVANTAVSTRFTIEVSTCPGASPYWSESTPIASRLRSRAASNTPCPVEPEAWKITSAPASYSASASSLPLVGSLNAAPVEPAYFTITRTRGSTAFAPAVKPAWNLRISGISMPPTNPSTCVREVSAASAPTRYEPCSSRNLSATRFGGSDSPGVTV